MNLVISASRLSFGGRGDDVARLHKALTALGRTIPADEAAARTLGSGTVAVVKAFQQDADLTPSGIVDAATVRLINASLRNLATTERIVRGTVRDANGNPFVGGFVQLFSQGLAAETILGKSPIDAADASFAIAYTPPATGAPVAGRVDVRAAVFMPSGAVATTIPSGSTVLTNPGPLEVIDFVVEGDGVAAHSEVEQMIADIGPFVGSRPLDSLVEHDTHHDISVLAAQTGYTTQQIAALVTASRIASGAGVPTPVVYALIRQGLPADLTALKTTHAKVRARALEEAVNRGMVPAVIDGKNIEDHLANFTTATAAPLTSLFGTVLNADEMATFVGAYVTGGNDAAGFWNKIAVDPLFKDRAPQLQLIAQLSALTNNHVPLVNAVRAMPNVKNVSDLASLSDDEWKTLVTSPGVGVPPDTPGANAEEQVSNYVRTISAQVEAAFPTRYFAARLPASGVKTFFAAHQDYDLRTTYPAQFFKQHPAAAQDLSASDRRQLERFQRLHRLTSSAEETRALADAGIRSSSQISRMDRSVFVTLNKPAMSEARAGAIYNQAVGRNAVALALFGENAISLNRTGLQAVPKLDAEKQAQLSSATIPDWETLFGTFDLCACQECASVHGPAAYFVDILHFLGDRNVRDQLFARRADLGEIELSCANTNTPVPTIDLVNEILENAVSPPPPFAPFDLASALEPDLNEPIASTALSQAFTPALQPGTQVEIVDPGKRWRVWDETFAYTVVKDAANLRVTARSRQTSGLADDRRATPQYRNALAYLKLAQEVYPWTVPFDLAANEARVFLAHLGVARSDLIEGLGPKPEPFDPASPAVVSVAAERLGLTDIERKILVEEPLAPPRQPQDYWGGDSVATLSAVQALLDRSELTFSDVQSVLATTFVNPTGAVTVTAAQGAAVDTCDVSQLVLNNLTPDVLSRLHRFVRLWRTLGWTTWELDRAITAFAANPANPVLDNRVLVRIDHLNTVKTHLRSTIVQALSLWKPIDTAGPTSLYARLFYDPAVFNPQQEAFRLTPDGQDLVHADETLADHADVIQAALRLNAPTFILLAAKTNGKLTLANISLLYRHALLARQAGLSVLDLLTVIDLTGLDPFRADQTENAPALLDAIAAIATSGFSVPQLRYILRQQFDRPAPFVPLDSSLTSILNDVRTSLKAVPASADQQNAQRSAVIDRIAAALALPSDVTSRLLDAVHHGAATALERFTELLATDPDQPLSRTNAQAQFETLEKLLKISSIIGITALPGTQLDWLFLENPWLTAAPDPAATPIPFASWFSLIELQRLRQLLNLEEGAVDAILGAILAVRLANTPALQVAAKQIFIDSLSTWLGWDAGDLSTLVGSAANTGDLGLMKVAMPAGFGIDLVVRLNRAMALLKRLGVAAAQASQWGGPSVNADQARAIRAAAKAKYDAAAWRTVVTPLQNKLRQQQRKTLVSYLAARPSLWNPDFATATEDELFSFFLVDVGMSACQLTSRLKQAIGSVQLFAQRCLMGLEDNIQTGDPKWNQWEWMNNFRVWEANRKIWLYPENWIEPDLRDDKTPFFEDLENQLQQSDLDNDAAERAFRRYLEKLDTVSHLEIAGMFEDSDSNILHVFGRTRHTPHIYYYRSCDGTTETWTAWAKVDLDVEGDHLIPVVWNRKLMLIWPIFAEKAEQKDATMPSAGGTLRAADHFYEIQLAWSEYHDGAWSGKRLSEPVTFAAYQGEDKILFGRLQPPLLEAVSARRAGEVEPGDPVPGGGGGNPNPSPVPPPTSSGPRHLVSTEQISFKALVSPGALQIRGYLRRDYRPAADSGDRQIACPFGAFVFSGCHHLVTPLHNGQIALRNFALAPRGTKFDRMWFTQTGSGLTMLDGQFPAFPKFVLENVLAPNVPASIAGDPSSTLVNKIDIPVLDQSPSLFKLQPPHQDLQFVGDRPFFFGDRTRTFIVTSTGSSGKRVRPDRHWATGDLGTLKRVDFFPAPSDPPVTDPPETARALSVLVPGPNGIRVVATLPPVNPNPRFAERTVLPIFWTTRQYTFTNFHHPYVCSFLETLDRRGIPGLLSIETQSQAVPDSFNGYQPEGRVTTPLPVDEVEFQSGRAFEIYNWELFFHIPLLIATRLSQNQRFADAQRWFHYIFNPTGPSGEDIPARYWITKPFHDRLAGDYEAESVKTIETLAAGAPLSDEFRAAVALWRSNPFSPHAVARLRTTAYQKNVVMKYLDNLIAWGDQLFRSETLEAINQASQLYVLAADILGRRPEVIDRNIEPPMETFNSIEPKLGLLSNALEQIELLIPADGNPTAPDQPLLPDPPSSTALFFCVDENDNLLRYWGTIADRLFKVRHCMNIEGQVRQLPLFEPPIDPALLVRARAAGLSVADVLSDVAITLPNYRFSVIFQKARELAAEVAAFGGQLLAVLEKRDAEALATLRSSQELRIQQLMRDIRVSQAAEAKISLAALEKSREGAVAKQQYYATRQKVDALESISLLLLGSTVIPIEVSAHLRVLAGLVQRLGNVKVGSPTTAGVEIGGYFIGVGIDEAAIALDAATSILNVSSQVLGRMAEYGRRKDEWDYQADQAAKEIAAIDQQIAAAQIRLEMADAELRNHDQQIDDAREQDRFLRTKYTNQDLYQYVVGEVSGVYLQAFQVAYNLAKRAEMCMQHEFGMRYGQTSIIRFGYWDSLRKGLVAGERLTLDLRRLETAFLEGDVREYELTKHISLLSLAPEQLIALKEAGVCEFEIPEWVFDLDTSGHFLRRLKSVSVTIPSVIGPYTTIHATLLLLKSSYRQNTEVASGYARAADDDPRFVDNRKILESIVTSTAQNDPGVFDAGGRDERYQPFEGAGAISRWRLELATEFEMFDYGTISDVILHLRYTARDGGDAFKASAVATLKSVLKNGQELRRLFSLRHEFPTEWRAFVNSPAAAVRSITVNFEAERFPYFVQRRTISIKRTTVFAALRSGDAATAAIVPGTVPPADVTAGPVFDGVTPPGPFTVSTDGDPKNVSDVFVVVQFST